MFNFGAAKAVDFLPDDEARAWLAPSLYGLVNELGTDAEPRRWLALPPAHATPPRELDPLFDLICGVQAEIGQADVEFTLAELSPEQPEVPPGFAPLGDPSGQLMHTFAGSPAEYAIVVAPAIFRVPAIVYSSIARELGRIALHRVRAPKVSEATEPYDREAEAELAAIALGLGVWVANGAYIFDNACCGGGCGIDLSTLQAGLSLPEACFALALDGQRRGLSRRTVVRRLGPTQKSALKRSWNFVYREGPRSLSPVSAKPSRVPLPGELS